MRRGILADTEELLRDAEERLVKIASSKIKESEASLENVKCEFCGAEIVTSEKKEQDEGASLTCQSCGKEVLCKDCGGKISIGRFLATRGKATRCCPCQQIYEKIHNRNRH